MSSEQKNVSPHILDNLPSEMLEIILDNLSFKDLLNCMTVCTKFYSFVTTSEKLNGKIKLVIDMKNFFENSEISTVLLRSLRPFANICVINDIHRSEENLLKRLFSNLGENAVSLGIGPSENQMLINLDFFSEILNLMPNIRSLTLNNVGFISDVIGNHAKIKQPMFKDLVVLHLIEVWSLWTMDGFFTMLKNCRKLVHLSKLMVLTEDAVISDRQCNVSSMWVKFLRRQQNLKALTIVSKTSSLFLTECFQDTPFKLISFIYKYSHDTDDIENDEPAENISCVESFLRKQDELCRVVLKLPSNVNFLKLLNLLKLKNELSILEINPSEDLQLIMYRLVTNTTVASLDLARPIPIELCHSIMDGFSNVSKLDVNVLSDLTKQISFDLYPRLISVSVTITGLYPLNWIESRNITSLKITDTLYSANLNWEDVATKIPNIKNLSLPLQTRTCLTLILKKFKKLKNLDCTSARNRMNHRFIPVICQNSSHLQWIGVKFIGKEVQYAAVLKDHKDDLDKLNYTFVYDE